MMMMTMKDLMIRTRMLMTTMMTRIMMMTTMMMMMKMICKKGTVIMGIMVRSITEGIMAITLTGTILILPIIIDTHITAIIVGMAPTRTVTAATITIIITITTTIITGSTAGSTTHDRW